LSVEEKIKEIRKAKGVTQKMLSKALDCGEATINRSENSGRPYTEGEIIAIREYLGVTELPLFDKEIAVYKEKVYVWIDRIRNELLNEAKKMREELSIIEQLPFETDLIMLFKLAGVRLLLKEGDFISSEEVLEWAKPFLGDTTEENQYHFHYATGSLHMYQRNPKDALQAYMLADSIELGSFKRENNLKFNLAICYAKLGKYVLAIGLLEHIYNDIDHEISSIDGLILDTNLGINYMRMNHIQKARGFFDKVLASAKRMGRKTSAGFALHNHGCICWKLGEFEKAVEYFDKASVNFSVGDNHYLENQYFKISCLIALKSHQSEKELENTITLAKDNHHYLMLLNSLPHLMTMDEASMEYIEKTTIPYLLDKYEYFKTFGYFEILEKTYLKKGGKMKSLEIAKRAYDVHKLMTRGEGVDQ